MIGDVDAIVRVSVVTEGGSTSTLVSDPMPLPDGLRLAASYRATGYAVSVRLCGCPGAVYSSDVQAAITPLRRRGVEFYALR